MSAAEVEALAAICFSVSATFLIELSISEVEDDWVTSCGVLTGATPFTYLPGKLSLKELEAFNKEEREF